MAVSATWGGLSIDAELVAFVKEEALPGTGIGEDAFWTSFAQLIADFAPRTRSLLAHRDLIQEQVDRWHASHTAPFDSADYEAFLRSIDYLKPVPSVQIAPLGIDPEIATLAGPQLVVPLTNARFVLNAVNARWGSLYDAFYGTDAVPEAAQSERSGDYNPERGRKVVEYGRAFLDEVVPLQLGSHSQARAYRVSSGALQVEMMDGAFTALRNSEAFAGYSGAPQKPDAILLRQNGLHIEVCFERTHPVGRTDPAGISDIILEAALSVIMDGEDSVATVDAADKVALYRNWLQLMQGTLTAIFEKGGRTVERRMASDRRRLDPAGADLVLPGRSVMLIRNVGLHLTTGAVRDSAGQDIPEHLLDLAIVSLIGKHDLMVRTNSKAGSIYIVRPKMHGPDEVALANSAFDQVESMLGLQPHTLKMGVMDEERRTSANLAACIAAARHRIFFINTGFLDRTGDEIHTAMEAGPVLRKGDIKAAPWLTAYEARNVEIGLQCGLPGKAQIGKGMWAAPDQMAAMMAQKVGHPMAGASTAWVPSPTAAVLHAIHYHRVDVAQRQATLRTIAAPPLSDLLTPPLALDVAYSADQVGEELDNNCQGILGYVVRWIDQGIGCSKVPDIHNVGLMEDRATLRISSQHIANWLRHGVVSEDQVRGALRRMAGVVDHQNASDPLYRPMGPEFDGYAFRAACDLVFEGRNQPNGYTEWLLNSWRRRAKRAIREEANL